MDARRDGHGFVAAIRRREFGAWAIGGISIDDGQIEPPMHHYL
jgi:hypothetical protein